MFIHPVIRIVSVMVVIAFLAFPDWQSVAVAAVMALSLILIKARQVFPGLLKMIWRLKWLYLSILIVYGWFTPGPVLFEQTLIDSRFLPSINGLYSGLLRVSVLVAIVSMVSALLQTSERSEMVSAVAWLTRPFIIMGLNPQQFSLLLVLTLERVLELQKLIQREMRRLEEKANLFTRATTLLDRLLMDIESSAMTLEEEQIVLPAMMAPAIWQWLMPVLLAIVFYTLG